MRGGIKEQDKVSYAPNAQCPLQLNPLCLQEVASFIWVLIPYVALVRRQKHERGMALKSKQKPVAPSFLSVDINQHISRLCLEAGREVREKTQKRSPLQWHSFYFIFFFLQRWKGFFWKVSLEFKPLPQIRHDIIRRHHLIFHCEINIHLKEVSFLFKEPTFFKVFKI